MKRDDWPEFLISKTLAGGEMAYYWNPTKRIMAMEPPFERRPLGQDLGEALKAAKSLNDALRSWIDGQKFNADDAKSAEIRGSIDFMFRVYRDHAPSKKGSFATLAPLTQRDYTYHMERFAAYQLKDGRRVGDVLAVDLSPPAVDALYEKFAISAEGKSTRRQANSLVATCRRAWNVAHRAHPALIPKDNPFEKMGLDHSAKETEPATYGQLLQFEAKALELDYPEIAFAARAAWEINLRVSDIRDRFTWEHYRPTDHPNAIFVGLNKNKRAIWKPLQDKDGLFYPDLERLISLIPKRGVMLCTIEARRGRQSPTGVFKPYTKRKFEERAAEIADAAGLPSHIRLAAFRHGGLTELGEAGLPDSFAQALSRHKQRSTLDRYIHRTDPQVISASRARRKFREGNSS